MKSQCVSTQMKAIEQYFHVVLFIINTVQGLQVCGRKVPLHVATCTL